jgi:hypothetical protein
MPAIQIPIIQILEIQIPDVTRAVAGIAAMEHAMPVHTERWPC